MNTKLFILGLLKGKQIPTKKEDRFCRVLAYGMLSINYELIFECDGCNYYCIDIKHFSTACTEQLSTIEREEIATPDVPLSEPIEPTLLKLGFLTGRIYTRKGTVEYKMGVRMTKSGKMMTIVFADSFEKNDKNEKIFVLKHIE